jgi:hypothetical protein
LSEINLKHFWVIKKLLFFKTNEKHFLSTAVRSEKTLLWIGYPAILKLYSQLSV